MFLLDELVTHAQAKVRVEEEQANKSDERKAKMLSLVPGMWGEWYKEVAPYLGEWRYYDVSIPYLSTFMNLANYAPVEVYLSQIGVLALYVPPNEQAYCLVNPLLRREGFNKEMLIKALRLAKIQWAEQQAKEFAAYMRENCISDTEYRQRIEPLVLWLSGDEIDLLEDYYLLAKQKAEASQHES